MVKEGFSGDYSTLIHHVNSLRYQIQWLQTFNSIKSAVSSEDNLYFLESRAGVWSFGFSFGGIIGW